MFWSQVVIVILVYKCTVILVMSLFITGVKTTLEIALTLTCKY